MCTCYPIINRVSELKVHIELTRFVQPEKIEIDANERAVNENSQYCFFVCTTFDSFLNDLLGRRRERKIDICGGKECMKKELRILVILIAVLLVGTVGYYFMPKKFGKNVNPSEVDHINVFDGNTGTGFTITDSEDIEYIVANIQGISMKRDGISLGRTGYSFKISYINSNDKDIIPVFILNSDNTICKDPFFYRCDGGLCFDYLKACEEKYRTNVTESIEEK